MAFRRVVREPLRLLRHLTWVWRSLFLQRYSVVIYTYSPRQGKGRFDEGVRVLSRDSPIPRDVKREFVRASGSRAWWAGRFMMVCQGAKLLYVLEDGKLCAYGWIRRLDPFLRCFRWLTPRGTVLGYFWTAPEKRGLGFYGRLLRHCIAISKDREEVPVIVYAASSNRGSLHGIEKAGFARLGEYEITTGLFNLLHTHRVISQEKRIAEVMAGA